MKYILRSLFVFALCIGGFSVHAEEISEFNATITVNKDGTFSVVETIVYDFEDAERHGIFRYIEKQHPQPAHAAWKERTFDIDLKEVILDGEAAVYEVTDTHNQLEVKIGDPYKTISGTHTYKIEYIVSGALSFFTDSTSELYWNVNGLGWNVPVQKIRATVSSPDGITGTKYACYMGISGSVTPCSGTALNTDGSITFTAVDLGSYQGLTIARAFEANTIDVLIVEKIRGGVVALVVFPILALLLGILGYRYKRRFKTGDSVIAQYEPYEDVKPMYAGTLLDGTLDAKDITAGIVSLAEQGYLKIKNVEKKVLFFFEVDDYEIELEKDPSLLESAFSASLITLLFGPDVSVGTVVSLSDLKSNRSKQASNQILLQKLRADLTKDMRTAGFFEVRKSLSEILMSLLVVLLCGFVVALLIPELILLIILSCVALCLYVLITYERRTKKGYQALDQLNGFKLFLSVTDKERFTFHNAPQKSPEQFMEYLPYAIAFGVEKQWAEAFKSITIPNPDWYEGSNIGAFSATNFATSVGAFSSSFASSTSGSSGSGSSGGGGGGGGGGSW